jgi:hypothetical protein
MAARSGAGRCRIMTGHETSVSKRLRCRDLHALIDPVQGTVSWLCVVAVASPIAGTWAHRIWRRRLL